MNRRHAILNAIVREFIDTAQPVGSHAIVVGYHFSVSPATIRNEMMDLEEEGLIFQPHTSAGRVPTDIGYRLYVNELADYESADRQAEKALQKILSDYELLKAKERLYDAVRILALATDNVSFATLPDNRRTFYLGIANVLRQPEFAHDPVRASQVLEVLEETDNFANTLKQLNVSEKVAPTSCRRSNSLASLRLGLDIKIFIGKENILPQIQSCALIATHYRIGDFDGYMGLLGPTRMRYPFNHAMVKRVKELVENKDY